jgi:hypothetical protein
MFFKKIVSLTSAQYDCVFSSYVNPIAFVSEALFFQSFIKSSTNDSLVASAGLSKLTMAIGIFPIF